MYRRFLSSKDGCNQELQEGEMEPEGGERDEVEILRLIRAGSDDSQSGNALAFLGWICLQVSHFAALNILSSIPRQTELSQDIKISLIAVNHSRPYSSKPECWEDTVLNLASCLSSAETVQSATDNTHDAPAAIALLRKLIEVSEKPFIFTAFRDEDHPFTGTLHSEAALASLAAYPEHAIDPRCRNRAALTRLISVCSHFHRCSPV